VSYDFLATMKISYFLTFETRFSYTIDVYFDFVIYFRIFSTIFSLFRKHNYVKIRLDFGIVFVTALHKVILSGHSAAQEIKHLAR
jgi:hypothetical protein